MKHVFALAALCLFAVQGLAQDPLKVLPQAYKLQFENDWVKVIIGVNQLLAFENTADTPAEFLRFDFKTKPLSEDALEKAKKHEHQESK